MASSLGKALGKEFAKACFQEAERDFPCKVCGKPNGRRCSKCMWVAYCSRECQGKDWNDHKDKCKKRETRIKANAKKAFQAHRVSFR